MQDPSSSLDTEISRDDINRLAKEQIEQIAGQEALTELLLTALETALVEVTEATYAELKTKTAACGVKREAFVTLAWLAGVDPPNIDANIDSLQLEPAAEFLVRRILALHGTSIHRAVGLSSFGQADDWYELERDIFLDLESGDYVIDFTIIKMAGERFTIRSSPSSAIALARNLVQAASAADASAFSDDAVEGMTAAWAEIQEKLKSSDANPATDGT